MPLTQAAGHAPLRLGPEPCLPDRPEDGGFAPWPGLQGWSPTPAIRASLALHAASLCAFLAAPEWWRTILAILGSNHALLTCGMWPRSTMLGPNLSRLPVPAGCDPGPIALTFDDGPDPRITPRLLDLLDRYEAKASFFVIGREAVRHPQLLREMVARGHSVENHTYAHPLGFGCWTPWAMQREIQRAQDTITAICGQRPLFFRPPAGIRSPLLDPVLAVTELRLATWTRRGYDTVSDQPERVLRRLLHRLAPGDILLLHDRPTRHRSMLEEVVPRLLAHARGYGHQVVSLRHAPLPPDAAARPGAPACPAPAAYASRSGGDCRADSGNARRRPPRERGSAPGSAG